jgi:hypothetical protein
MVSGWFCEKFGRIGKMEVLLKNKKRISTGIHFEEENFYPDEL